MLRGTENSELDSEVMRLDNTMDLTVLIKLDVPLFLNDYFFSVSFKTQSPKKGHRYKN